MSPFVRLRAVAGVVFVYLVVLSAWLVTGGWHAGRWFGVHLFTLGIVTNLVLALSRHFAATLSHAADRRPRAQLLLTNIGVVSLLWGIPHRADAAIAGGATLLVVEVMRSYLTLRRLRTRSLGGRWSWIIRSYERAHGAFVHGAILGALMGTAVLSGSWWASARVAHLHVNVLGWAGLTLLATLVFFGPTVMRTRIEPGADERAARALRLAAIAVTVAAFGLLGTGADGGIALAARAIAAAALASYAWAVVEIGRPLVAASRRANPSAQRAALQMVVAWFVVAVALDVVVVATASWRYLDALGVLVLAGVLFQAIAMSMGYLMPLVFRREGPARAETWSRIDVLGSARTGLFNAGVALAAFASAWGSGAGSVGALLARTGWAMIGLSLVWLAAAIAAPARGARSPS